MVLTITSVAYGLVLHFILVWFESDLKPYRGIEQAVFYFFSQVIAECVRGALDWSFRRVSAALAGYRDRSNARKIAATKAEQDALMNKGLLD